MEFIEEGCKVLVSAKLFIYLFGVLHHFQHCTGHITMGSWESRGNQYTQLVKVLYCKLLTNGKQLPASPLEVGPGSKPRSQRWKATVLPLCHRGPFKCKINKNFKLCQENWICMTKLQLKKKQVQKGFRSTSASCKAIRDE